MEKTASRGRVGSNRYVSEASQRACHFASRPSRVGLDGTWGRRMALSSRCRRDLLDPLDYLRPGGLDLGQARTGLVDDRGRGSSAPAASTLAVGPPPSDGGPTATVSRRASRRTLSPSARSSFAWWSPTGTIV